MFNNKRNVSGKYTSSLHEAKKKRLEADIEKGFKESSENRMWEVDELPVSVVRILYECITGKTASGKLQPSIKGYRYQVRTWLKKVLAEKSISDRHVASKIRCVLRPADHQKLGIRQFVEAFDSGLTDNANGKVHFCIPPLANAPAAIPQDHTLSVAAMLIDDTQGLQEQITGCFHQSSENLLGLDERAEQCGFSETLDKITGTDQHPTSADAGIPEQEFPILFGIKEDEGFAVTPEDIRQTKALLLLNDVDDDEAEPKKLIEIFRDIYGEPCSMGIPISWFTNLFKRIKKHLREFTPRDREKFPSHGTGLGRLQPGCMDNIKFRNLLHYIPDIDDFAPPPPPPPPRKRIRRKKNAAIAARHVQQVDVGDDAARAKSTRTVDSSSSDDAESESSNDESQHNNDDEDGDYANDPGSKLLTVEDDGLEEQIELDKKKEVQEMAYMGIENVLLKKNPGVLDSRAFENTLKAMMLLDPYCLSDQFVKTYFTEEDNEQPSTGDRGSEPLFVLDLFVDGVPVFKSSKNASCIVIMGRVVMVNGTYIPHKRSKPFIIGFYHGCVEKPELNAFLSDLLKELKFLDPKRKLREDEKRSITVKIRAIIGDAPARAWLKCVKGHSGYFACERCHITGEFIRISARQNLTSGKTKQAMKFSSLDDPKRVDERWDDYLSKPEPKQPGGAENGTQRHRTGDTPLDSIADLVKPISSFPLEEMHLVDGGTIKDGIKMLLKLPESWTLRLKQKRKTRKVIINKTTQKRMYVITMKSAPAKRRKKRPAVQKERSTMAANEEEDDVTLIKTKDLIGWNCRIANWSKFCTPAEFPRRVSKLTQFKYWKMVECRQFFMYYLVPLMLLDMESFDKDEFSLVVKFIKAYSLLTGSSYVPVPEADIKLAEQLFKEFFVGMIRFNKKYASIKVHATWKHLVEDARHFRCRTTSLSSYPYENQISFFRKCRLLNGRFVVKQLTNKLLRRHLFRTRTKEDGESLQVYVDHIRGNGGHLHFPAFHVWEYDFNKQLVECESLTISCRFPNNIVCLKDSAAGGYQNDASVAAIGCIDFMFPDTSSSSEQGRIKLQVRCFKKVTLAFKSPFDSSEIGLYHCEGGLEDRILQIPFSDLKYKCFAIPKKLPVRALIDPNEVQQSWICQTIRHSDFY